LKPYLPITYWTFLIGALAIAGVPFLSGFFSKDEILFETFAAGHWIFWTMGVVTSLLTATYMFRLVFLTFHGERRHPEAAEPASPGHHDSSHLHDAPPAMAMALVVLALGSVLAGYIGVPHVLGGENRLAAWLEPSFQAPQATAVEVFEAGPEVGEEGEAGLELTLMAVSSAIALIGIGLAAFIWLKRRDIAASMARSYAGLHRLLLNKYYVDEVYDAILVQPIRIGSQEGLWRGLDVQVVDGAVNGTGALVAAGSAMLRRLQTGSVRAYAGSMFVGVVIILGYYLWR
jgi:NADH-quinone oxidoreductase subunit L